MNCKHQAGLFAVVATVIWLLPASSAEEPKSDATAELALKGLDPVLLTAGKEAAGDKAIVAMRGGFRYQFTSNETRQQFLREPGRYVIQLEGACAAMPRAKGDPSLFAVHKNRIYIFGSEECRTQFIAQPENYVKSRKNVAIFLHEGVELLDFAGPTEVFSAANRGRTFNVYTVAASDKLLVSQGVVTIKPQYTLANCPKPDIIVLPGGATRIPLQDEKVIEWIKKASADTEVTMSVCTGAFLLAKAGLLDGKEATTHYASIEALRKTAKQTKVHADRRFVDNGKVITSAGVSAGIDAALHVVERLLGAEAARETARYMEYRWDRDSGNK